MAMNFGGAMANAVSRNWWLVLIQGVAAVVFGILALIWPHITLFVLVILFGVYAIIDGIAGLGRAFSANAPSQGKVWLIVGGVVSIIAGILAFVWPGVTALVLLYIIGAWAVILGIAQIIAAIGLRHERSHMWLEIIGGAIAVIFGIIVFARPGAGALTLVWLIGFFAIILGISRIALAFELHNLPERWRMQGPTGTPRPAA